MWGRAGFLWAWLVGFEIQEIDPTICQYILPHNWSTFRNKSVTKQEFYTTMDTCSSYIPNTRQDEIPRFGNTG